MNRKLRVLWTSVIIILIVFSGFEIATLPPVLESTSQASAVSFLHSMNSSAISSYNISKSGIREITLGMVYEQKYQATTRVYLPVYILINDSSESHIITRGITVSSVKINSSGLADVGYTVQHNSSVITLTLNVEPLGNGSVNFQITVGLTLTHNFLIFHVPYKKIGVELNGTMIVTSTPQDLPVIQN